MPDITHEETMADLKLLADMMEKSRDHVSLNIDDYDDDFEGSMLYLNDVLEEVDKKTKASNIIKKQWSKCRWDPDYAMCWICQLTDMNEIFTSAGKEMKW